MFDRPWAKITDDKIEIQDLPYFIEGIESTTMDIATKNSRGWFRTRDIGKKDIEYCKVETIVDIFNQEDFVVERTHSYSNIPNFRDIMIIDIQKMALIENQGNQYTQNINAIAKYFRDEKYSFEQLIAYKNILCQAKDPLIASLLKSSHTYSYNGQELIVLESLMTPDILLENDSDPTNLFEYVIDESNTLRSKKPIIRACERGNLASLFAKLGISIIQFAPNWTNHSPGWVLSAILNDVYVHIEFVSSVHDLKDKDMIVLSRCFEDDFWFNKARELMTEDWDVLMNVNMWSDLHPILGFNVNSVNVLKTSIVTAKNPANQIMEQCTAIVFKP